MATKDQKDQQPQEQPSEDQQAPQGDKPVTYIVNGIEVDPNGQPVKGGK